MKAFEKLFLERATPLKVPAKQISIRFPLTISGFLDVLPCPAPEAMFLVYNVLLLQK